MLQRGVYNSIGIKSRQGRKEHAHGLVLILHNESWTHGSGLIDFEFVNFHSNRLTSAIVFVAALIAIPLARAQDVGQDTKQEKEVPPAAGDAQKLKARQEVAITNIRQIGLAMFEFETEYGEYPSENTAALVKDLTKINAEIKAVTANDCFFQLIAADIVRNDSIFSFDAPAVLESKVLLMVAKCSYACLSGMNAMGDPMRPLVVSPLIKGKTIFDPQILGGKAVILRVDNSVTTLPIEKDGRVLVNGLDIFDPAQPFWKGKVPPIKWPEN